MSESALPSALLQPCPGCSYHLICIPAVVTTLLGSHACPILHLPMSTQSVLLSCSHMNLPQRYIALDFNILTMQIAKAYKPQNHFQTPNTALYQTPHTKLKVQVWTPFRPRSDAKQRWGCICQSSNMHVQACMLHASRKRTTDTK